MPLVKVASSVLGERWFLWYLRSTSRMAKLLRERSALIVAERWFMLKDVSRVAMVVGGASAPNKKGASMAPFL
jgi:hypothetical protein